jgi:AmmeMemoRadiSam system protein A
MPINPLGLSLLTIARNSIGKRFGIEKRAVTPHPELAQTAASFVTLMREGKLRGCIGSLDAYRSLGTDVAENAFAAAFCDPRFPALANDEFAATRIEVSLLEKPQSLNFSGEGDAIAQLCPGVDGLILTHGSRRATFLPQVWESLSDPRSFLGQLKVKAGLSADFWDDKITLARYGVQKWKET